MPFVRIDLIEGKTEQYRSRIGEIAYDVMRDELNVPEHDRFQVIAEHAKTNLPFDRTYLGVQRSDDCVFFQITLNAGRSVEMKQRFYRKLADRLHADLQLRKEDVFINLIEVQKENWSFGNGEAQYAEAPK